MESRRGTREHYLNTYEEGERELILKTLEKKRQENKRKKEGTFKTF